MCRVLQVKEGSYYAWRKRGESARARKNAALVERLHGIAVESKHSYGSRRLTRELRKSGVVVNRKRVVDIMRRHGIRSHQRQGKPAFYPASTDANTENVLDRHFDVSEPNRAWASDITYIPTREGWLYLAVTLDLFSRCVIGWSMDRTRTSQLVLDALSAAIRLRRPPNGFIHHSDRGTQYTDGDYVAMVSQSGGVCSLSRKGNCWDNAVVESFFATLKRELLQGKPFGSRDEARAAIFEYIESWYNRRRLHSTLGYMSPVEFEQQAVA